MSATTTYNLEAPAAELIAYLSQGPPLYELPLADARAAVDGAQAGIPMPDVDETWVAVPGEFGDVRVLIIKPQGAEGPLPVVLYMHGGGWIFGILLCAETERVLDSWVVAVRLLDPYVGMTYGAALIALAALAILSRDKGRFAMIGLSSRPNAG